MPNQNYYSDASAPTPAASPAEDPQPKEGADAKEGESDSQTAELPKAVLGGKEFKPGEEVTLQVVQVMEDSVLVKYASEKPDEEEPPSEPTAPAPGGGNSMSSMMQ